MNLLGVDNTDKQTNVSMRMKKMQMNLLNVDIIDCQINVSMRKKKCQ